MWRNWPGEQACLPAAEEHPSSVAEVVAALERAAEADQTVRVAGSGHSFSDLVPTTGRLLLLHGMDRVLDVDRSAGLVRVEGGITLHALNARLADHGLAMENLGDIDKQTLAGAIATGTHGTGAKLPNLSAQVESIELVTADGTVIECGGDDTDLLRAARVSLGALGVVTAVTLRCVPAFTLRRVDEPRPLDETLERLDELVDSNEHFEFWTFPYSPVALTRTTNRVEGPPKPPGSARRWLEDVALTNGAFGAFVRLARRAPWLTPFVNRAVSRVAGKQVRVDRSDRVFASPRLVRFVEMEYAVPREAAAEAVRRARGIVAERRLPVCFPLECRFAPADDAFLSTAHGRETAYVAIHVFERMPWEEYFRAFEEAVDELGGRPHWGKRHFRTAETLRERYPEWDRFQAARARLDAEGRFQNAGVERVLGPVGAPVGAPSAAAAR